MKMRTLLTLFTCSAVLASPGWAAPHELTLKEVLEGAANASYAVQASRLKELAAARRVDVARSTYYPKVEFEAAENTGFAGSMGHMDIKGPLASPYRVGPTFGVVSNINLWDFGRTSNAVTAAEHRELTAEAETKYRRYEVYQSALQLFYQCAMYRSEKEAWTELADDARLVRKEVERFVRTGQRSIVERYLADSQTKEAETQMAVFDEREKESMKEIGILTNLPTVQMECPSLPSEDHAVAVFKGTPQGNPMIAMATAKAAEARAEIAKAKADFMPKLAGVADAAWMQDARVVPKKYWAVGVALFIPIFEGFKTVNEVKEANQLAASAEKELAAKRQEIDELNAKYDRIINSSKTALDHLREEGDLARNGFVIAKKRYFGFQGSVVDVREAFRNLSRTESEIIESRAQYLDAVGAKAVLNGTPF